MAHIQFTDEIVKEYLIYRGFSNTLKVFENELKLEKDKGFRVDKIVENLIQSVHNYDLSGLRDTWSHLETKIFTKVDHHMGVTTKKLESALLKYYLVHAIENGKSDKVNDFFSKTTQDLSGHPDWKDWFTIPYIKYPEENALFAVYFTKLWQDSLFVSLHNFLAAAYQNLPQPTLSAFEESASKMAALQKENELLRRGLANMLSTTEIDRNSDMPNDLDDIMDDFINCISQEVKVAEHKEKTLKSLTLRATSTFLSTSPKSSTVSAADTKKQFLKKSAGTKRSSSSDARQVGRRKDRDSSLDATLVRSTLESNKLSSMQSEGSFLFLSQDEYNEHACEIKRLKLNGRGNMVASLDVGGCLRVWTTPPSCRTVAVFLPRPQAELLEWVLHHERYLLCADPTGPLRLLDVKDVQQVWEIAITLDKGTKLEDIISNPAESSALIIANEKAIILDLKSRVEKYLQVPGEVNSCAYSLNGQLVFCGCKDGRVVVIDVRKNEVTDILPGLSSPIVYVHLTIDGSNVFYLGCDWQLRWLSLVNKDRPQTLSFPSESQFASARYRPFCLDSSGSFLLTLGTNSGVIYKISQEGITKCLELGGHKFAVTCIDWCFANQCATCVTASSDGNVRISTLLIDTITP